MRSGRRLPGRAAGQDRESGEARAGSRRCAAWLVPSLLAGVAFAGEPCATRMQWHMGTILEITACGKARPDLLRGIGEAFDEVRRLEAVLSTWRADSEASGFNRAAGGPPRPCSPPFFELLALSLSCAERTGGAFTPAAQPLVLAWGLEGEPAVPAPGRARESAALSSPGVLELDRERRTARLREPGAGVNFGAIGKGYALDRAGAVLAAGGIRDALLNFGGQMLALGARPGRQGWRVTVADPLDPGLSALTLAVSGLSVATSNARGPSGAGPAHILDPRTGRPAAWAGAVAATAPNAAEADALATALAVLGPGPAARACLRRFRRAGAAWISSRPAGGTDVTREGAFPRAGGPEFRGEASGRTCRPGDPASESAGNGAGGFPAGG